MKLHTYHYSSFIHNDVAVVDRAQVTFLLRSRSRVVPFGIHIFVFLWVDQLKTSYRNKVSCVLSVRAWLFKTKRVMERERDWRERKTSRNRSNLRIERWTLKPMMMKFFSSSSMPHHFPELLGRPRVFDRVDNWQLTARVRYNNYWPPPIEQKYIFVSTFFSRRIIVLHTARHAHTHTQTYVYKHKHIYRYIWTNRAAARGEEQRNVSGLSSYT